MALGGILTQAIADATEGLRLDPKCSAALAIRGEARHTGGLRRGHRGLHGGHRVGSRLHLAFGAVTPDA